MCNASSLLNPLHPRPNDGTGPEILDSFLESFKSKIRMVCGGRGHDLVQSLESVVDLQVSVRLEHPETISTRVDRRNGGSRVTQLQVQPGEDHERKPDSHREGRRA